MNTATKKNKPAVKGVRTTAQSGVGAAVAWLLAHYGGLDPEAALIVATLLTGLVSWVQNLIEDRLADEDVAPGQD